MGGLGGLYVLGQAKRNGNVAAIYSLAGAEQGHVITEHMLACFVVWENYSHSHFLGKVAVAVVGVVFVNRVAATTRVILYG